MCFSALCLSQALWTVGKTLVPPSCKCNKSTWKLKEWLYFLRTLKKSSTVSTDVSELLPVRGRELPHGDCYPVQLHLTAHIYSFNCFSFTYILFITIYTCWMRERLRWNPPASTVCWIINPGVVTHVRAIASSEATCFVIENIPCVTEPMLILWHDLIVWKCEWTAQTFTVRSFHSLKALNSTVYSHKRRHTCH